MLQSYCVSKALLTCYHHTVAQIIGPKLLLSAEVASIHVDASVVEAHIAVVGSGAPVCVPDTR
jgi:hypothetical protein